MPPVYFKTPTQISLTTFPVSLQAILETWWLYSQPSQFACNCPDLALRTCPQKIPQFWANQESYLCYLESLKQKGQDLLVYLSCPLMTLEQRNYVIPLGPLLPHSFSKPFTLTLRDEEVRTHDSYWSLLPSSFVVIAYLAETDLSQ